MIRVRGNTNLVTMFSYMRIDTNYCVNDSTS